MNMSFPQSSEVGVTYPIAGAIGVCEDHHIGAGDRIIVFYKSRKISILPGSPLLKNKPQKSNLLYCPIMAIFQYLKGGSLNEGTCCQV